MRLFAGVVLLVAVTACGGKAKPRPAAPELSIATPASFAGSWLADDDLDWGYHLEVGSDSQLLLTIDRGKMGRCEQRGVLKPGRDARTYEITYVKNTCTPDIGQVALTFAVESYTGGALRVAVTGAGVDEHRSYTRDPKVPAPAQP